MKAGSPLHTVHQRKLPRTFHPVYVENVDTIPYRRSTEQPGFPEIRAKGRAIRQESFLEYDKNIPVVINEFASEYVTGLNREDSLQVAKTMYELCQQDAPQDGIRVQQC